VLYFEELEHPPGSGAGSKRVTAAVAHFEWLEQSLVQLERVREERDALQHQLEGACEKANEIVAERDRLRELLRDGAHHLYHFRGRDSVAAYEAWRQKVRAEGIDPEEWGDD
jgi:hypothetical protein